MNNGADISSDSDLESVGGEGRRGGREPVARNQGRGRGPRRASDSTRSGSQPSSEPTAASGNNMQDLAGPHPPVNEVSEQINITDSAEMGISDLKITLNTTRDELTSFMFSVTGVLCSLFSVLTSTQITEIENSNGDDLKDDKLFKKCINHAKNTAAIREKTYKDALVDESKKKKTNHRGNPQSTPVSFAHARVSQGITVPPTNAQMRSVTPQVIAQAVGNLGGNRMNQSERGTNHMDTNDTSAQMSAGQRERENNWLEILDANRKYNLILFRINDTNNKNEDNKVVEGMMRAIGCAHRISEKTNIIRLGAKRNGKFRPLMVCFSNENAVNQVLARSPNLCRSTLYGHIYVKRDLPRSQRPSANRREVNVLAEAGWGGGTTTTTTSGAPAPAARVHSGDADDDDNGLSDIDSESDFTDTDQDRSSDDEDDTLVESDAMDTCDEASSSDEEGVASRNEEEGEGGRGGAVSLARTPRFTSTANIVLMSTPPSLEIQGAAASDNSEFGETNPVETVPSGNDVLVGGGVTG